MSIRIHHHFRQMGIGLLALLAIILLVAAVGYVLWRLIFGTASAAERAGGGLQTLQSNRFAIAEIAWSGGAIEPDVQAALSPQMAPEAAGARRYVWAIESCEDLAGAWAFLGFTYASDAEVNELQWEIATAAASGGKRQEFFRAVRGDE